MKNILFFLIIFFFANLHATSENDYFLKKLYRFLDKTKTIQADFLQHSNDSDEISTGNLIFDGKKMRIDYKNPEIISLIITEKNIIYHNHELDSRQYLKNSDNFYLQLLNKNIVSYINNVEHDEYEVIFTINANESFIFKLIFTKKPFNLKQIQQESENETVTIDLQNIVFNHDIAKNAFSVPKIHSRVANY